MKRTIVIALSAGLLMSAAHAQEIVTLDQALEAARANNCQLQVAGLEARKAGLRVTEARAMRFPSFSLVSNESLSLVRSGLTIDKGALGTSNIAGPIPSTDTTLTIGRHLTTITQASATEPLSQQYRLSLLVSASKLEARCASLLTDQTQIDIDRDLRTGYFNLQRLESQQRAFLSQRDSLTRLVEETTNAERQRTVLKADLLNATSQLADIKLQLARMEDPIASQRAELNRMMGKDVESSWETSANAVPDDPSLFSGTLINRALVQRPDIAIARTRIELAELEARAKRAERIPDISFAVTSYSTVNLNGAFPSDLAFAGVQVSWDVFDWGRKRSEWRQKLLGVQQAKLNLAETSANATIEVDHRRRKVEEARVAVTAAEARVQATQEALRVATDRYNAQEILLSDRLAAHAASVEADSRLAVSNLELATALGELKRSIGAK